jgi:hypothetical protein
MNEGKESWDLAEARTDQIKLRDSRGNLRAGKYGRRSCRKGRQRNRLSHKKACDKEAAFLQPSHDPSGIITWIWRQKHAENGKQQEDDDCDLKRLLHKKHDSTVLAAKSGHSNWHRRPHQTD